jgi:hypothetical protein
VAKQGQSIKAKFLTINNTLLYYEPLFIVVGQSGPVNAYPDQLAPILAILAYYPLRMN